MEDRSCPGASAEQILPDADARLLEQIRSGDAEAGQQFVREHYHAIYRYLLYLTEQPDQAEDLTQETFLQGWRYLDTFQGRGSLRAWLLRIARREFLHLLQRRQAERGSEGMAEVAARDVTAWMESVELRQVIDRLPLEEREVVLLHHLEGYTSSEIAPIVGAPARTVRLRLEQAREHLRQELGEDDLLYLNEPLAPMRQWAWLPLDRMHALEARLSLGGEAKEDEMERREFLRQTAVGAAGLMLPETGKEVVDGRLTQKVTLAFKGTALSDLCDHLRSETGVHVAAGPSVTDEKVTLFCEKLPLREVMRQLSRPFGYTWLRSGSSGQYRYELAQDLKSELLEEELRNQDRNLALLALEKEIERYRPYLNLSPDEALARAKTALPAEKPLLEKLATSGWGPIQLYFRLSNQERAALRAGQTLTFSEAPRPGEQSLAPELARGVFQSFRDWRVRSVGGKQGGFDSAERAGAEGLPLTEVPELRASVKLSMPQRELGELTLDGGATIFFLKGSGGFTPGRGPYASGRSPTANQPDNRAANLRLAGDRTLSRRVTVYPHPSYQPDASSPRGGTGGEAPGEPKVTTADVLEALHQATGLPLVADYYTRLFIPSEVTVRELALFEALGKLADAMRLRWRKEAEWLEFRSASYYDDRIKEVPNRLLSRWSAARRQRGMLRLDDLLEIVQLPDAQLDAAEMAEGARQCYGLAEWELARNRRLRPHLRYLATFTPDQRRTAMSDAGLPFARMTLAQQQQFIAFGVLSKAAPLQSLLEDLADAVLRVEYTQPGWFRWGSPDAWDPCRWVVRLDAQRERRLRPSVQERSREGAIQALRQVDPQIREAVPQAMRRLDPRLRAVTPDEETQIFPTRLSLAMVYIPGGAPARDLHVVTEDHDMFQSGEP